MIQSFDCSTHLSNPPSMLNRLFGAKCFVDGKPVDPWKAHWDAPDGVFEGPGTVHTYDVSEEIANGTLKFDVPSAEELAKISKEQLQGLELLVPARTSKGAQEGTWAVRPLPAGITELPNKVLSREIRGHVRFELKASSVAA